MQRAQHRQNAGVLTKEKVGDPRSLSRVIRMHTMNTQPGPQERRWKSAVCFIHRRLRRENLEEGQT